MRVYVCQLYRRWLVCRIHAHLLQYMLALMIGGRRGGRHRASHLKCTTEGPTASTCSPPERQLRELRVPVESPGDVGENALGTVLDLT